MTSPRDNSWDLFVSYAHRDNAAGLPRALIALVQDIQRDLDPARPWHVFFDTHAIRVLDDWEKRIGSGLRSAGVMLALVSPAYFQSEWCKREWEEFREQEQRRGEPRNRIAVLYLETDPTFDQAEPNCEWRRDLKRRQYLDLRGWVDLDAWARREQLSQLVYRVHGRLEALLSGEARRLGVPYQFPQLPIHYITRPAEEQTLQHHLLSDTPEGSAVTCAVFGMGGIGKSTLVSAVVRKATILNRFPDGVLWVTLGQSPEVLRLLGEWIRSLGDYDFKAIDMTTASGRLRQLLHDRQALLVIDDGWNIEDVEPFRVAGPGCRMVVTTRRRSIAEELGGKLQELGIPSLDQAVSILTARLQEQRPLGDDEREPANRLAETLGRLPLALALAGVRISRGVSWADLQAALEQEVAALEKLEDPASRRQDKAKLEASFKLSLDAIRTKDEEAWQAFTWLGVLPEDVTLTAPMARTLWKLPTEEAADVLLEFLWGESLLQSAPLQRVAGREWRSYRVHDLLHDHARRLLVSTRTLVEAHHEFLNSYRTRTQNGLWHTLGDDGYFHAHLGWHLEKAGDLTGLNALLREEMPDGRNGWFESTAPLGHALAYLGDVARAFRLNRTPGLQCRYALILASLNSRAANVPAEIIVAIVRHGLWPVGHGLTYARRNPSREERAAALTGLIPLVGVCDRAAIQAEALQSAATINDEYRRSSALAALAPHLPTDLLSQALQAAAAIRGEFARVLALAAVAHYLPADERVAVIDQAFQTAAAIGDGCSRCQALSVLVPHLPTDSRVTVLTKALETAVAIADESQRCEAIASLAAHLDENLLRQAYEAASAIHHEGFRSNALMALAPSLPANLLPLAREAAANIHDGQCRSTVLAALARHLPADERNAVLAEALRTVQSLQTGIAFFDEGVRSLALCQLAPHLSPDLLAQAFQTTSAFQLEGPRGSTLAALAPHLPADLLPEALQIATAIGDEELRRDVLATLAPHLPTELLPKALRGVARAGDEDARCDALTVLVPHLPPEKRDDVLAQALQTAAAIRYGHSQCAALADLSPYLPEGERADVLDRALQIAASDRYESMPGWALAALAPHLPANLLPKALEIAMTIGDEALRASALADLTPYLNADLLARVLETAANDDKSLRCRALTALARHRSAGERNSVLTEARQTAAEISDERLRCDALVSLAPLLTGLERTFILAEARQAAEAIQGASARSLALAELAPHLPHDERHGVLAEALRAAAAIRNDLVDPRGPALAALAQHLPADLLPEALQIATATCHEGYRSQALVALALHLPEDLLPQALELAAATRDEWSRTCALVRLGVRQVHFGVDDRAQQLVELLGVLGTGTRQTFTAVVDDLVPIVTALPGFEAPAELAEVASAIIDVGRWWP